MAWKSSPTILLVDGDIIAFLGALKCVENIEWEEGVSSSAISFDEATADAVESLKQMGEKWDGEVILCFGGMNNFRKTINPTYKSNRLEKDKPPRLSDFCTFLRETHHSMTMPRLEGDDCLGLSQAEDNSTIICSSDKDLAQIPGRHYNFRTGEYFEVTPEEGERSFYMQVLTGDATDGYKGCPGFGPVKAGKVLDGSPREEWWEEIRLQYLHRGLTEDEAVLQARMAYILRSGDYNHTTRRIRLWTPPGWESESM